MRYLTAAGPFVRRQLRPPEIPRPQPVATERYAEHAPCLADIYVPEDSGDGRTALVVHGGGFAFGARDMSSVMVVVDHLLQRGFVVASVDYRLVRVRGPRLEGQRQDAISAARWWHDNAARFGGDPQRTTVVGLSAGGALGLFAAGAAPLERFVGIYGAYDLTQLPARWLTASVLTRAPRRKDHARHSPLIMGDFDAPALLIHGLADPLAVPGHTEALARLREERGLPTEIAWIEGAVHGFFQDGVHDPHAIEAFEHLDRFLGLEAS